MEIGVSERKKREGERKETARKIEKGTLERNGNRGLWLVKN
jgi:hypothetical protein